MNALAQCQLNTHDKPPLETCRRDNRYDESHALNSEMLREERRCFSEKDWKRFQSEHEELKKKLEILVGIQEAMKEVKDIHSGKRKLKVFRGSLEITNIYLLMSSTTNLKLRQSQKKELQRLIGDYHD